MFGAFLALVLGGVVGMETPAFGAEGESGPVVTKVRVLGKKGSAEVLKGARITGSITSATNDFVVLGKIEEAKEGWLEVPVDAKGEVYRFVKIETPPNSYASVAEIEFYSGEKRLQGKGFGTNGSRDNKGNTFEKALDGDPETYFEGPEHAGQYVGIDLGEEVQVAAVTASPSGGKYETAQRVELKTATEGAEIHYRLDGQTPGLDAPVYKSPIEVKRSCVLHAVAYRKGLARSVSLLSAYRIGAGPAVGGKSYATFHIGNSLTDTVDGWLKPVMESAGYSERFYRFTIPGAPTDWLWDHPGSGFGDS
jgi:hypothetical protein